MTENKILELCCLLLLNLNYLKHFNRLVVENIFWVSHCVVFDIFDDSEHTIFCIFNVIGIGNLALAIRQK